MFSVSQEFGYSLVPYSEGNKQVLDVTVQAVCATCGPDLWNSLADFHDVSGVE